MSDEINNDHKDSDLSRGIYYAFERMAHECGWDVMCNHGTLREAINCIRRGGWSVYRPDCREYAIYLNGVKVWGDPL